MANYTYTFYDIPSGTKLGSLPLYGVSVSDVLATGAGGASAGAMTGAIRMDSDFVQSAQEILDMTRPEATAVWMDRNETPIWCGILWTRTYQSDGRVMQFNAQGFQSYLSSVVWWPTRGPIAQIPQYDLTENPHNCARFIYQYLRDYASAEYDIGVQLETYHQIGDVSLTPSLFTTISFLLDDHKYLSEYMDLALKAGAEYRIRPQLDANGNRVPIFESMPTGQLGVSAEGADVGESFEYPGEMAKYWYTNSAANAPTRLFGTGKSAGADAAFSLKQGSITGRIGVDKVQSYDTDDPVLVSSYASADIVAMQGDLNRPVYDIAGSDIDMGWSVGDRRRVIIDDPYRFTRPMSGIVRITGWQLSPSTSDGVETLSITIDNISSLVALNV
jgi:hypothetical protein